ncbi:hypothetical protein [Janibacter sp. G1551]|uniref:hypothetical protein n=1 Tax=Janibacter sp. G1551 TaxID=3420440 RepID=UPI003D048084
MAKAVLLAWASPANAESVAEFHQWYDETHIPQIREAIPSISAVTRYELTDPASGGQGRFLAVYELEDSDLGAAAAALGEGIGAGRIIMSPAMDLASDPPATQWYTRHPN